jgi:hypothetical protein
MSTVAINEDSGLILDAGAVLQIHVAEYQCLTSRCNYWISIQFALLPLFLVIVGIVAQMWSSSLNHALLLWGGMGTVQLIVMTWLQTGLEIYNAVFYIECELRPLVGKPAATNQRLWGYEGFLARQRSSGPRWEEYTMALGSLAGFLIVAFIRWPLSTGDWIGLGVNTLFLVVNIALSWRLVNTRLAFSRCAVSG